MASGTEEKPPLYPGYYPGEPYSRRPQGSGVVKQPFGELEDPNDVLKMIDEDLENIPLHPSWWGEQIKEDIRSATVIRASPMKDKHFDAEKAELAEMYGEEESAELPGTFDISFDLKDIADPKEIVKSLTWEAAKSSLNYGDFTRRKEREFYGELLDGQAMGITGSALADFSRKTAEKILVGKDLADEGLDLKLKGRDTTIKEDYFVKGKKYTKEVNLYDKVANNVVEFISNVDAASARSVSYGKYQNFALKALGQETLDGLDKLYKKLKADYSPNEVANMPEVAALQKDAKQFVSEANLGVEINDFFSASMALKDELEEQFLKSPIPPTKLDETGKVFKQTNKMKGLIDTANDPNGSLAKVLSSTKNPNVKKYAEEYKSLLSRVSGVIEFGPKGTDGNHEIILKGIAESDVRNLHNMLGAFNKQLYGGNFKPHPFSAGIMDKYRNHLLYDFLESGNRDVVDKLDLTGAKRLGRLNFLMRTRKEVAHVEDVLDAMAKDNYWRATLWAPLIKPLIDGWTPSAYLGEIKKKSGGFGTFAVLGTGHKEAALYGPIKKVVEGRFSKLFENKFSIEMPSVGSVRILGGKQFASVADLAQKADQLGEKAFMNALRTGSKGIKGDDFAEWLRDHTDPKLLSIKDIDDIANDSENYKTISEFLQIMVKRAKDTDRFPDTRKYLGWLEKYTSYLNKKQTQLFEWAKQNKYLKGLLVPTAKIRATFAVAVSKVITPIVTQLVAAVTGGLGELAWPIIERISNFIVSKVLSKIQDTFVGAWKLITQGDFQAIIDKMDENAAKWGKRVGIVTVIVQGCIFLIIAPIFVVLFSAFAVVDHTIVVGGGDVYTPGAPNIDVEISGSFSISCFNLTNATGTVGSYNVSNWPSDVANGVIATAINTLQSTGLFLDDLCAGGDITVYWHDGNPGYCGHVYGGQIVIHNNPYCVNNQDYMNYLFAHESGHVYQGRHPEVFAEFITLVYSHEGSLPSYPGNCSIRNTASEGFADLIGNIVWQNTRDCGAWSWGDFPLHVWFAQNRLFNE